MGSDGFTVDLDVLGVAQERVARLTAELPGTSRDVPDAEVFGHRRLAAAVTEFARREQRGLAALSGEADAIRHGLAETVKTYRRADENGAGLFRVAGA